MIKIIYGWYNPVNPLFGTEGAIMASDIKKSYLTEYTKAIIKQCKEPKPYYLYIEYNKDLLKEIEKQIRLHPECEQYINLVYDNGYKFWQLAWNKMDAVIKQAKEDIKAGM